MKDIIPAPDDEILASLRQQKRTMAKSHYTATKVLARSLEADWQRRRVTGVLLGGSAKKVMPYASTTDNPLVVQDPRPHVQPDSNIPRLISDPDDVSDASRCYC